MSSIPSKCPSCSSSMAVTQLSCTACGTAVVGHYQLGPFHQLSGESLSFLETFVRNRGNIKEMERESGESYWAIRKRLDQVIAELGFDVEPALDELALQRQEILQRLSQGELEVQEATRLLAGLGRRDR